MSLQGLNEAPSRRYIRAYLVVWAVLATGALGYLVTLAWQPEQLTPAATKPKVVEADPNIKIANEALAEVGSIKQAVGVLQKDVGELKDTLAQHSDQDKTLQSRLTALEEKVATIPNTLVTTSVAPTVKAKTAEKTAEKAPAKATDKAATDKAQQKAAAKTQTKTTAPRIITIPSEGAGSTSTNTERSSIETGSIAGQSGISFGEAVVTRAAELYAVNLGPGASLDALRMRWGLLVERYGATLATLQPRFVPPRTQGAPYRLLAGPLASTADVKDICAEMRADLPACSATDFAGEPL